MAKLKTAEVLALTSKSLEALEGHIFDLLTVSKPVSVSAALNLLKVLSKLSPLLGNLIEFNTVEFLNDRPEFKGLGNWKRQDPGFPDAIFEGDIVPQPGLEIKAWFPLATEITARFRDSQSHFAENNTSAAILAWLPDQLIYGKPYILDVCIVSGLSVAKARDDHYHNPPDYLVIEPLDTTARTRNLQQTNTAGYKWQGIATDFVKAKRIVEGWGKDGRQYKPTPEYQAKLMTLMGKFPYRLDTNFSKIDRIVHPEIEAFKTQVLSKKIYGKTLGEWTKLFNGKDQVLAASTMKERLDIKEEDVDLRVIKTSGPRSDSK